MENLEEIQSQCAKDFKELKDELDTLRKEWQNKAKTSFKEAFSSFFATHPEVKAIVWDQYTPYFNDGDPCEFSINEAYFVKDLLDSDGNEIHGSAYEYENRATCWSTYSWNDEVDENTAGHELKSSIKAMSSLLSDLEDFLLATFGDHVTVAVTPENIETREYDHD